MLEDRKLLYGNTVGSQSKCEIAYIAGFLDGDGSVMLQVKKRNDTKRGVRFMATICLYQDTRHEKPLLWMRKVFGVGYISRRKDGITELRINGFKTVRNLLTQLSPYVRFKRVQVDALIRACEILLSNKYSKLADEQIREVVRCAITIQNENYTTHKKRTESELLKQLGLTP